MTVLVTGCSRCCKGLFGPVTWGGVVNGGGSRASGDGRGIGTRSLCC